MSQARVLIVHPEPSILALLGSMLQSLGHQIDEASIDRVAVRRLERGGVDLMILGVDPFDPEGLELLSYSRRRHPGVPVMVLFPGPSPERSRDALRMGASTVLKFPMPATELRAAVTQACERAHPSAPAGGSANGNGARSHGNLNGNGSNGNYSPRPSQAEANLADARPALDVQPTRPARVEPLHEILGQDQATRQAVDLASTVAPARASVLILGEQGTGKTLLARAIHRQSSRRDQPFVEISCAGIDELGLERELFGQKFEGADSSERPGRLVRADGGTIFLDEIAALSPALQAKLLAVLVNGEFEPLGSSVAISVDVRFVFSTRENLSALVEQGKFRRELHERINAVCLKLPPLRQRGQDIALLAENFREQFTIEYGKPVMGFSPEALDLLGRHDWPGNVRELESVIQRGVAMCQGPMITPEFLAIGYTQDRSQRTPSFPSRPQPYPGQNLRPLKEALEEPEKQIIIQALRALNWNRQETARVLDINRTTLYKKMKKYGLLMEEPALLN